MSYNFKKIIDLELVNEVPEGANVLIEADGATKRLPSTAIKPAPIQSDLSQNDPSAPDYVKNRTHYEETTVVNEPLNIELTSFDGLDKIVFDESDPDFGIYYKVSDAAMTTEQVRNVVWGVKNSPFGDFEYAFAELWDEMDGDTPRVEKYDNAVVEENLIFVFEDNVTLWKGEEWETTFPTKGIYVCQDWTKNGQTFYLNAPEAGVLKTVVHKLDKKYLPDDVGGDGGGSTTFYILADESYVYVDPDGDIQADSNDITNAMNKGAVYFDYYVDDFNKYLSSTFAITRGSVAGMQISVIYRVESNAMPFVKKARTSDYDNGPS